MTKDEFKILAKGMKAVYTQPSFLPDADALNVWYSLLQDLPYDVCNVAIQKYMMTESKIPTIADIRNLCAGVVAGEKPLWSDGWEEVCRAISRWGSYGEREAMESFTDITKQTVQRLGYRELCMSENPSVDRANFRMIYEQIANREYERQKLPLSMQNLIATIQEKKKMLELKGE